MSKINAAKQDDTEGAIFGGSIPAYYDWWVRFERGEWKYDDDVCAPDGWTYNVVALDPHEAEDSGKTISKTIAHADIMKACRKIVRGECDLNEEIRRECRNMLFDVDKMDMDAIIADAVLQVAVFGESIYG